MSVSGPLTEKLKDGGDGMIPMLRLLADPEAMRSRLDELTKAEEKAKAIVDLVGPAEEVLKLRDEAKTYLAAQQQALAAADARAKDIVAAAEQRRAELLANLDADTRAAASNLSEAKEVLRKANAEAEAILANAAQAAADGEKLIQQKQAQLDAELSRIADAQFQLDQERAAVAEQRASMDAKLAKMAEAWGA